MKKRYVVVIASLISLTGWIGFSNATVNVEQSQDNQSKTHILVEVHQSMMEENYTLAEKQLHDLALKMDTFSAPEQAKIWETYAFVSFNQNQENLQATTYLDKALALEDELTTAKRLKLLDMGQKFALSQNRYDKQIAYANKWVEIADANTDKKDILFFTAYSHFNLQQYDASTTLLNELIAISDSEGYQPKEMWLGIQLANHMETKNLTEMIKIQEKIAQLYPSEKNDKLLARLNSADYLQ